MPHAKITSLSNPKIKGVVKLRDRRSRDESGQTIVEGTREVMRGLEADIVFKEVYVSLGKDDLQQENIVTALEQKKVPIFDVPQNVFKKISYGTRSEGILAVCSPALITLEALEVPSVSLFIIIEGVEKPGNLGAVLRSCDAAGVNGLIIADGMTDVFNPNVIRASIGTVFTVPVAVSSSAKAVAFLKKNEIKICAAVPDAQTVYLDAGLNVPVAIVMGSEQKGLSDLWKNAADMSVTIPMRGKADSLNVSTSAAILIYEAARQRREQKGG